MIFFHLLSNSMIFLVFSICGNAGKSSEKALPIFQMEEKLALLPYLGDEPPAIIIVEAFQSARLSTSDQGMFSLRCAISSHVKAPVMYGHLFGILKMGFTLRVVMYSYTYH